MASSIYLSSKIIFSYFFYNSPHLVQAIRNLRREYLTGPTLTVDEQLMPRRGRCRFLQDLPSKPDKYGITIFWICHSENGSPFMEIPSLEETGKQRLGGIFPRSIIALLWPWQKSDRGQFLHGHDMKCTSPGQ